MKQAILGNKVLELRNNHNMTQKELAEICNVDIRTIQRIEASEVVPRKHTIKLLAKVFDCETSYFQAVNDDRMKEMIPNLSLPYISGIIFSINYLLVVFHLITDSLNFAVHIVTLIIHITTCIYFFKGFYALGKYHKNQMLVIASMLYMILLPLLNVMYLFGKWYYNFFTNSTIFTLVCINAMTFGVSLLFEDIKRGNKKISLFKIAGIITILQSILFLSSSTTLINTGLISSVFCNLVMIRILYDECKVSKEPMEALLV